MIRNLFLMGLSLLYRKLDNLRYSPRWFGRKRALAQEVKGERYDEQRSILPKDPLELEKCGIVKTSGCDEQRSIPKRLRCRASLLPEKQAALSPEKQAALSPEDRTALSPEKQAALWKITAIAVILMILCCGEESVVEPEHLNVPMAVQCYPKNRKIKIKFTATNDEEKFDGFNIYISKTSSIRNQTTLLPLKNSSGSYPSIVLSAKDIKENNEIATIISIDENENPIENGCTYFIAVRAHNIYGYLSDWSNELSTTPRIEAETDVNITSNQGFNFSQQIISETPDFKFGYKFIGPKQKCVIYSTSGSSVQDKGYYENWEDLNSAPVQGYISEGIYLEAKEGHVYVFKTASGNYAKIQVISVVPNSLKFKWAYQTVQNNTDI